MAKRIVFTLALGAGLFIFLAAVNADATPIRPDIRKLVSEPQQDFTAGLGPARAGWDGPEMPARTPQGNPTLAVYDGAAAASAARTALLEAATPDPRAVLGIVAVIFLLRMLRSRHQERTAVANSILSHPGETEHDRLAA